MRSPTVRNRCHLLCAKNGINSRRNFWHSSINVEREADQIHFCQSRIGDNQSFPGHIAAQVNSHNLVVTIAQILHPAEKVAEMNQACERPRRRKQAHVVVASRSLSEFLFYSPVFANLLSRIAM